MQRVAIVSEEVLVALPTTSVGPRDLASCSVCGPGTITVCITGPENC